jgi:hypothetical protein
VSPAEYGQRPLGWHDFFLASAGASAGLLGLLFVGVSINLAAISADERIELRTRAAQAFANLVFVLVVSLLLLVPNPDPSFVASSLAVVAAFGLYRVGRNLSALRGGLAGGSAPWRATIRRVGWTAVADLVLLFTAWRIWESRGEADVIANLIAVVLVLLVGAADISWEMLTEVSQERR